MGFKVLAVLALVLVFTVSQGAALWCMQSANIGASGHPTSHHEEWCGWGSCTHSTEYKSSGPVVFKYCYSSKEPDSCYELSSKTNCYCNTHICNAPGESDNKDLPKTCYVSSNPDASGAPTQEHEETCAGSCVYNTKTVDGHSIITKSCLPLVMSDTCFNWIGKEACYCNTDYCNAQRESAVTVAPLMCYVSANLDSSGAPTEEHEETCAGSCVDMTIVVNRRSIIIKSCSQDTMDDTCVTVTEGEACYCNTDLCNVKNDSVAPVTCYVSANLDDSGAPTEEHEETCAGSCVQNTTSVNGRSIITKSCSPVMMNDTCVTLTGGEACYCNTDLCNNVQSESGTVNDQIGVALTCYVSTNLDGSGTPTEETCAGSCARSSASMDGLTVFVQSCSPVTMNDTCKTLAGAEICYCNIDLCNVQRDSDVSGVSGLSGFLVTWILAASVIVGRLCYV